MLRAALEADKLARALEATVPSPRNASMNLLLGQAGPAGGELIDLELVPGDAGWLHPVDGVLAHANHLETALPVYDTIKDCGGSSLFRSRPGPAAAVRGRGGRQGLAEDDLMHVAARPPERAERDLPACRRAGCLPRPLGDRVTR